MRRLQWALAALLLSLMAVSGPARSFAKGKDWPEWLRPTREGVWRETGLVDKFPPGGPPVVWRKPIGSGYSGPAVAGEFVYVMDRQRLLGKDGKPVPGNREGQMGTERVLCLKAADGTIAW